MRSSCGFNKVPLSVQTIPSFGRLLYVVAKASARGGTCLRMSISAAVCKFETACRLIQIPIEGEARAIFRVVESLFPAR